MDEKAATSSRSPAASHARTMASATEHEGYTLAHKKRGNTGLFVRRSAGALPLLDRP